MSKQIDALKLALEAFEWNYNTDLDNIPACEQWAKMLKANITAIKEALAQEQEPVAWSYWQSCLNDDGTQTAPWVHRFSKFKPMESIINKDVTPLYTTPPQRKPLTDDELFKICMAVPKIFDFARAIEAAHGIKENT